MVKAERRSDIFAISRVLRGRKMTGAVFAMPLYVSFVRARVTTTTCTSARFGNRRSAFVRHLHKSFHVTHVYSGSGFKCDVFKQDQGISRRSTIISNANISQLKNKRRSFSSC